MDCPNCGASTGVLDSRTRQGTVARRRRCNNPDCKHIFTTKEVRTSAFLTKDPEDADSMKIPKGCTVAAPKVAKPPKKKAPVSVSPPAPVATNKPPARKAIQDKLEDARIRAASQWE